MKTVEFTGRTSAMRTNTPWLASEDLMGLGPVKVTIEGVYHHDEAIFDAGRKEKNVFSVKFAGKEKQLVLNSTNRRRLVALFDTTDVTKWKGKEVTLVVSETKLMGQTVPCIRVKVD